MITKEFLQREYLDNNKTAEAIGKMVGKSRTTILRYIEKLGIPIRKSGSYRFQDLTNKKYGCWTVIKKLYSNRSTTRWLCKCDCGEEQGINAYWLKNGKHDGCSKCNHHNFTGFGNCSGTYINTLKQSAKTRGIEFKITAEQAWKLFEKQDGKCVFSGRKLILPKVYAKNNQTASLDRIDSSKGYVKGNVQWIDKEFQTMKWDRKDEDFLKLVQEIYNYKFGNSEL